MKISCSLILSVLLGRELVDVVSANIPKARAKRVGAAHATLITNDASSIVPSTQPHKNEKCWELTHPSATYISFKFESVSIDSSCQLRVSSPQMSQSMVITHPGWGPPLKGSDTSTICLTCDDLANTSSNFEVREYSAGHPLSSTKRNLRKSNIEDPEFTICNEDDTLDITCLKGTGFDDIYTTSRGVCEVHVNGTDTCTGFFVSVLDHFLTNEHCIYNNATAENSWIVCNYEALTCDGQETAMVDVYPIKALEVVDFTLDFALLQIGHDPTQAYLSSKYPPLRLSTKQVALEEIVYVPQHPDGKPKKVTLFDSETPDSGSCKIISINQDSCREDGTPTLAHSCDTDFGSSGSPVICEFDNTVIGLHHCGGGDEVCARGNFATPITEIYPYIRDFIEGVTARPTSAPTLPQPSVMPTTSPTRQSKAGKSSKGA